MIWEATIRGLKICCLIISFCNYKRLLISDLKLILNFYKCLYLLCKKNLFFITGMPTYCYQKNVNEMHGGMTNSIMMSDSMPSGEMENMMGSM